jgi:cytoskeletal protein CcmA (bactofilin family)
MTYKRHRFEIPGVPTMSNDDLNDTAPHSMEVGVGNAMPAAQGAGMPVLNAQLQAAPVEESPENSQAVSKVADGMRFAGNAILRGPCSIAGLVEGNLTQATDSQASVVVTETGRVTGDVTAQKISVMGQTEGLLDSGQGEVTLHATARVQGRVRYRRIQVNGADLNATLERVTAGNGTIG